MSSSAAEETSRIALYLQVTNMLRSRIMSGHWKAGAQLPTIEQLMAEYGVSRITVRQALTLLARSGLIVSTRGRGTFVAKSVGPAPADPDLRTAISSLLEMGEGQAIELLSCKRVATLPADFEASAPVFPSYMRIQTLHRHNGEPFAQVDAAVAAEVYRRFPPGAEKREKLLKLLVEHGRVALRTGRQEITITYADAEVARRLDCVLMAPTVRIRSWRRDTEDRLVFVTISLYRADRFVYDVTEYDTSLELSRTLVIPTARTAAVGRGANPRRA